MSRDSEEIFDSECYNCLHEGKHVQAEVFCVECEDNLCWGCLKDHNKMAKLRSHTIQDKSAVKSGIIQGALHPPTEKCFEHHGRLIDTYCASHDVVCCSACVSVDHKSCPNVKYLPTVASGTSTSEELQDVQTTIESVRTQLDSVRTRRQQDLVNVKQQRTEALEKSSEATQQLVDMIEELGKETTAEITEKYKKLEESVNKDLDELNASIATLLDKQNQLQDSLNNDTKLFVHVKQSKRAISTGRKLAESCWTYAGVERCTFVRETTVESYLKDINSLGHFEEDSEYYAADVSGKNIKSSEDTKMCDITGICSFSDKNIIIADARNRYLKKLNEAFEIEFQCALHGIPHAVCQTSPTEVAVTMFFDKKIQFVSVGQTMSLTRSVELEGVGFCGEISYKDRELYVGRRAGENYSCIQVYNMNGTLLRTIEEDQAGTRLFTNPPHLAFSAQPANIYVADDANGFTILDKSGQLVSKITDPDLKRVWGICVLPGNQLLVCDYAAHSVIQFNGQGRKVNTLLTSDDGLKQPQVLHFDPRTYKLFVGMETNDEIKVINLKRK